MLINNLQNYVRIGEGGMPRSIFSLGRDALPHGNFFLQKPFSRFVQSIVPHRRLPDVVGSIMKIRVGAS
jgi:hypothetical protein